MPDKGPIVERVGLTNSQREGKWHMQNLASSHWDAICGTASPFAFTPRWENVTCMRCLKLHSMEPDSPCDVEGCPLGLGHAGAHLFRFDIVSDPKNVRE